MRGKSFAKDKVEADFEALLNGIRPHKDHAGHGGTIFKEWWEDRRGMVNVQIKSLVEQISELEKKIGQLLDRIVDTSNPSIVSAY